MQRRSDVCAAGFKRRANGPADLAMRVDSPADEARPRGEDEVAGHPLPDEMKIVAVVPHVLAGARDEIDLPLRVVRRRSWTPHAADLRTRLEESQLTLGTRDVTEAGEAHHEHDKGAKRRDAHGDLLTQYRSCALTGLAQPGMGRSGPSRGGPIEDRDLLPDLARQSRRQGFDFVDGSENNGIVEVLHEQRGNLARDRQQLAAIVEVAPQVGGTHGANRR